MGLLHFFNRLLGDLGRDAKAAIPALLAAVGRSDASTYPAAGDAALSIGAEADTLVPVFVAGLTHADENVRFYSGVRLGIMGRRAEAAIPDVARLLVDQAESVRREIPSALYKTGGSSPEAVAALTGGLSSADRQIREQSAVYLGKIGPPHAAAAVDPLRRTMHEDTGRVRVAAAAALMHVGDPSDEAGAVSAIEAGFNDEDPEVRLSACEAMQSLHSQFPGAVAALTKALSDPDEHVRGHAARGLYECGADAEEALPAIATAVRDTSGAASFWALRSLTKLTMELPPETRSHIEWDPKLAPALIGDLESDDYRTRRIAAIALGSLPPTKATLATLRTHLTDDEALVRVQSAIALCRLDESDADVIDVLIAALLTGKGDFAFVGDPATTGILKNLGEKLQPGADKLKRALGARHKETRLAVAGALICIDPQDTAGFDALIALMNDPDPHNRALAIITLYENVDRLPDSAVAAFIRATRDPNAQVRYYACRGLQKAGANTPEVIAALEAATHDNACLMGQGYVADAAKAALADLRGNGDAGAGHP